MGFLIEHIPDCFVLGTDLVGRSETWLERVKPLRRLLDGLSKGGARGRSGENVRRLWWEGSGTRSSCTRIELQSVGEMGTWMSDSVDELPFLVTIDDEADVNGGEKGIFRRNQEEFAVRKVPVDVLKKNVQQVVEGLREVLEGVVEGAGVLPLKTAQVAFEVTATGGITLVGTAQVSGKGAITLTFGQ
ncbi:hypothetical protein [Amycolatopsis sp. GM8]|uniref:Pepco domain-containing protein n=1 Tax=Amycolatopsis sp. GM8 TaxID=2896530 RepID=UPI001F389C50|nr:hypothetical protein [Amycolatopsis sp. GM8]